VIRGIFTALALLALCPCALAGEIYRYRTADGKVLFTDTPQYADTPGAPGGVRAAEAELMQAYNRLTFGVRPLQGEVPKGPEYNERISQLTAEINNAQKRLDAARGRPRIFN
jgi:hypothetical protein